MQQLTNYKLEISNKGQVVVAKNDKGQNLKTANKDKNLSDGNKLVKEVIGSKKTVTIVYDVTVVSNKAKATNLSDAMNPKVGSDSLIRLIPNKDTYNISHLNDEGTKSIPIKIPSYIVVGHELIHANAHMTGTKLSGKGSYTYLDSKGNLITATANNEELATVGLINGRTITQNTLLIEHGYKPAVKYGIG